MSKQKEINVLTKEDIKVIRKINRLKRLFKHYGLVPFAYNPGVRCYVDGHGDPTLNVEFDDNALKFMVPLLEELLKYRKHFDVLFESKKSWWKRKEVI